MNKKAALSICVFVVLLTLYPILYNYSQNNPKGFILGDPKELRFSILPKNIVYVKGSGPLNIDLELCNEGFLPIEVPSHGGVGSMVDLFLEGPMGKIALNYPRAKMAGGSTYLTKCEDTRFDLLWIPGHYQKTNTSGVTQRWDFSWNITGVYTLTGTYDYYYSGREIVSGETIIRIVD